MFAILMLLSANLLTDTSAEIWNSASQVAVVVVCDATTSAHCANSVDLLENTVGFLKQGCEYNINGSLYIKDRLVPQDLPELGAYITNTKASFVLAFGTSGTIQAVSVVAKGLGLPLLGYITAGDKRGVAYSDVYVSLNARMSTEGAAMANVIGEYNMPQTVVLIQDLFLNDGFLTGFESAGKGTDIGSFKYEVIWDSIKDDHLERMLTELSITGWKIIVLHCTPKLMQTVVHGAIKYRFFGTGHAWFMTEKAYTDSPDILSTLPEGLLSFQSYSLTGISGVLLNALKTIAHACLCQLSELRSFMDAIPLVNSSDYCPALEPQLATNQLFMRNLVSPYNCENASSSQVRSPTDVPSRDDVAFHLYNLRENPNTGIVWSSVGYITASGVTDLKTVLWPGRTIYGPASHTDKTYRVVTRPAKPFVFIEGPVDHPSECFADQPCIEIFDNSPSAIASVIETFLTTKGYNRTNYRVHCCKGLALELLDKLAVDLNFDYVIYFLNDTDYGTYKNGQWSGMVSDIVNGAADLVVGAFSVTSERLSAMSFTEPYFQNDFAMVTSANGRSTSIWAFLSPFSPEVWICILVSSVVAGIATSTLEWYSPFGLNPRGRRRDKNYTLGSGLLMVWVLVTGHTINVKAPKSWPGKVIQNVWAGLAIFMMTSYTANLAAYLAGQSAVVMIRSIFDSKLLSKKVSLIKSSAVEAFLSRINPDLYDHVKTHYTQSAEEAILKLRKKEIDVYLDDSPILEYAVTRLDQHCSVRFAGKGFGADGYAFGLPRFSWMQVPLTNRILSYSESGYIQDLSRKYLSRPNCEGLLANSAVKYGLEHTGGLFIILSSTLVLSVLLVCLEHCAYRYIVPWIRRQPATSWWKTEGLAFISQRLHRVVRSEVLYSQKQAAQEMMKIVRDRDFTRLIQKQELQKRRMPRKKEKTRAEVFQEITANIVSYHREMKNVSDAIEDIGGQEPDITADATVDVIRKGSSPDDTTNNNAMVNQSYDHDRRGSAATLQVDVEVEGDRDGDAERLEDDGGDRYPTLVPVYPSLPEDLSEATLSQDSAVNSGSESSPENRKGEIWVISDGCINDPDLVAPTRKFSDIGPLRPDNSELHRGIRRSISHEYQTGDYFQRNLKLKDNRVKSTLRRHAMSGYQAHVPVDYLDECTIESLSKEDLLLLWKKSELELQRRLREIQTRNKTMSLAIDYLMKSQQEELGEEV
ncbi:glutamate receptor ionotropic, NMDA 3A-like [Haliotis cracherodii]|uniref:glutamate receptor ionotropic, NMDA 3A-like n=1 Tax=Haliotis cracherodii TaxID=6455 RepID=UPI0039E983ED